MRKAVVRPLLCCGLIAVTFPAFAARRVAFNTEGDPRTPGSHGLAKLKEALEADGFEIASAQGAATADLQYL